MISELRPLFPIYEAIVDAMQAQEVAPHAKPSRAPIQELGFTRTGEGVWYLDVRFDVPGLPSHPVSLRDAALDETHPVMQAVRDWPARGLLYVRVAGAEITFAHSSEEE